MRSPTFSTTLQEVGILPTLVLFPPLGLILGELLCRCPKGLFRLFKNSLWSFLWPICGRFYEPIWESLWHVQSMVLRAVWVKILMHGMFKGRFRGYLD